MFNAWRKIDKDERRVELDVVGVKQIDSVKVDRTLKGDRLATVSPETVVRVLDAMRRSPQFQVYYDALPVAGVDGTLRGRMRSGTPLRWPCSIRRTFSARWTSPTMCRSRPNSCAPSTCRVKTIFCPSGETETVVYDVIGSGRAINITYVDAGGLLQTEFNVMLPWSKEVQLAKPANRSASVSIINVGREISCSITLGGTQIQQRTGSGLTICSALG